MEPARSCPYCPPFSHPELVVARFGLTIVSLNPDQYFPGYCFVFTKEHVTELFHLSETDRHGVIDEVNRVAAVLHRLFRADKMNYELLGNMVPHIHWHLIPRSVGDPLWPRPVWSEPHEPRILSPAGYGERISLIRSALEKP